MGFARFDRRSLALFAGAMVFILVAWVAVVAGQSARAATGCGTAANPVVCENALAGTNPSVWDISGAGDPTIQGFSTDISANVGTSVGFKIKTDARAYTIQIFRTGYYQGLGARKIADVTPSATLPQTQPNCVTDATVELTDCGNWGLSATWSVPSDAVSGVYIALLTRTDTGGKSQITFIVRNDASHSDVLFQTSDPTWQAYNTYGGSDFYQGAANGRAYKISYNRPVTTRGDNSGRDFYFANEYPAVRFLEKNGYNVSYFSGVDTDRYGAQLKNHKVFLSVGHDEYWSAGQRNNVVAARDAGVNLQFLSGNEMYWHTRYESSVAGTATAYRTLVSYKETWANDKIDPTSQWTGTWRDPRFASQANGAGLPENAVTGTQYMSNFSDLAVTVSAAQGKTRMWRNTGLSGMAAGATTALAPHTIGYESNEDVDNGFRPAGLVQLSTTTGAVPQYLQDFGNTVVPGTTTHHVTLYRAASGALVFSAGTIQWSWGLDQEHDGDGAAADARMQQAQVNLLADMGAQPATLASGLIASAKSSDTTAPTAAISTPAAGATVANGASVTLSGTASDSGGVVAGVEVSTDGGSTYHAATGTTSWSYTYAQQGAGTQTVKVRAIDDSGNFPATPTSRSFSVSGPYSVFGAKAPAVVDSGDATPVEVGLQFTPTQNGFVSGVRFYKASTNTGTHTGSLWDANGNRLATVTFTGETASGWQTASFSSQVAVTSGTKYVVSYTAPNGHYSATNEYWSYRGISADPLSVAGGFGAAPAGVYSTTLGQFPTADFDQSNYWVDAVFTTTDVSPLTASGQYPLPSSSSVPANTAIGAVFSKPVTASTIAFSVKDQNGATVPGTVSYAAATRTATFTPSAALNGFVTYSVTLAATDPTGKTLSAGGSWSFTTVKPAPPAGTCPCSLFTDATTPSVLQVADNPVTLGVRFQSSSAGAISGVSFYKNAANTGTHVGALWTADGQQLAQATFTNESSAGWQTVTFSAPVSIAAGTTYVASYSSPTGSYSVTPGDFSGAGVIRGPLTAGANAGGFTYPTGFPGGTSSSNYLVDVVFSPPAPAIQVTAQSPVNGATNVVAGTPISITFSSAITSAASVTVTAGSSAVAGTKALSSDGKTLTFTPTTSLAAGATIGVSVSGIVGTNGATLPTQSWTFVTQSAQATTYSLFGNRTPAVTAATDDPSSVELGMSFSSSVAGTVNAIRFFKGATNTGTHTGSLWDSSGNRLATVTFTGETASGWQTAQLSTPLAISAGATYIVSYLAPKGNYSYTSADFAAAQTSGPLTAGTTTNGRYLYTATGGFPIYSWNATNYFVDVVFAPNSSGSGTTTTGGGSTTPPATQTLFADSATPASTNWPDGNPVTLGVRFTSTQAGSVTGIRFYKGAGDTGIHTATLWNTAGQALATGTFGAETASGWQDVTFATPVPIQAGVEYRASYRTTGSTYAVTAGGLASATSNGGALSIPGSGGVYSYANGFPDQIVTHNYWVDIRFQPSP